LCILVRHFGIFTTPLDIASPIATQFACNHGWARLSGAAVVIYIALPRLQRSPGSGNHQ
jgi:hypothetical protein